ncbi:MAG: hypothetical protein IJ547_06565, partial [Clostridia bacterium]|nr:hypothetical protein [Clostridia bacterium]
PFEKLSSVAQEQFPGNDSGQTESGKQDNERGEQPEIIQSIRQTAEQMRDDLGISNAQMNYIKFKTFMENLETRVTELPYKPLIVLALLVFFALKSFVGIVPVSATCLIAAVIFPFPVALLINFIGVGIIFTIKYAMGRAAKSNGIKKFIMKSDGLWKVVSDADNSTKKVLKETNDKRKAEKAALNQLQGKNDRSKKPVTNPVLRFFIAIGKGIGKVVRVIRDKLLKVPVLSILIDEEDAEQSAKGGTGNPLVLFALRLVPFVPANPVSSLFGNLQMDYRSFLLISLFGYLVKVISFTAIGYNIADPFTSKFIVPFIALLYLAGFGLLIVNNVLKAIDRRNREKESEELTET